MGRRLALRAVSGSVGEFVRHVDVQVWFTGEVMREQRRRAALLHRAASAAFTAPARFGMPGWPGVVASAVEQLAVLDRSGAPDMLSDWRQWNPRYSKCRTAGGLDARSGAAGAP
ncbi:hypothetical protein ACFVWX_25185 [Streptomyces sp. NPDC058220]|uniref:hypothetical protein n=1 Tax=Streptomyces sp. NPDC058220 TaxID=3346387 RepID=UPI0036E75518